MNKMEVIKMKSKYCDNEHYCIVIDGIPLDSLLQGINSEEDYEGLIPTILDWVDEPREKSLVLSRYTSPEQIVMLPILMCPDDCDLWCTLIVVEVVKEDSFIKWSRIGLDRSTREELINGYECIGKRVEWFANFPSMIFKQEEYYSQINKLLS
ncbi:hypothetical protein M3194_30690 [Paenibacillus glycanilyticus]|uniref:hypothetical protein n=1 Tax=Paenibacillus glycanilyticus TaxID=126569 RepID=UPI00203FD4FE|nr:hypothetical protein [Paenibacillus glycanilyticus]MCM3631662.1 hypothetical protein [Paenibacillus glycanilyticus]